MSKSTLPMEQQIAYWAFRAMQKDIYDTICFMEKLRIQCVLVIFMKNLTCVRYATNFTQRTVWWPGTSPIAKSLHFHSIDKVRSIRLFMPKFTRTFLYDRYIDDMKENYKNRVLKPYLTFKAKSQVDNLVGSIIFDKLEDAFKTDYFNVNKYKV